MCTTAQYPIHALPSRGLYPIPLLLLCLFRIHGEHTCRKKIYTIEENNEKARCEKGRRDLRTYLVNGKTGR
jgi:hypothetical protein